jgi:group I intron endonuclease
MFIYLTENLINGKKYIGYCSRDNDKYLGSGKILKQAIEKYGRENFKRIILEKCDDVNELSLAEEKWIKYYNAVESDNFYNISEGGFGGNSQTVKKYWAKMDKTERSERNKHRRGWNVAGEKNPMFGKSTSKYVKAVWDKRSEEDRKKIGKRVSETKKKLGSARGEKNPMYGRSIVKEKNLKWYTDGKEVIYVTEGTEPKGFVRGRKKNKC